MKKYILLILTALTSLFITEINYGQATPPNLGTSAGFAVFTSAGAISNTGPTIITGDVGNGAGAITGFPPGIVKGQIHQADSVALQAATDVCAAYNQLLATACDTSIALVGGGQTLTPGVYCVGAASAITGDLILDAQGNPNAVFIFKINGVLTTALNSRIVLTGGASLLCNVFFGVTGAVNLGINSLFQGTLLSGGGAVSVGTGATLNGRALVCAGAINLDNNTINNPCTPGCPTIAAPTANVTQPTCTVATGTITVTSGTQGLTFSLNSTDTAAFTNTTGIFNNLAPGTYIVRSRNASGCISNGLTVTINAQPATPGTPTANVTQPTCTVATGTITVTSDTSGLRFSINSTDTAAFTNTTGVFSNLAPGTYIIRARNAAGCISAGVTKIVNATPCPPTTCMSCGKKEDKKVLVCHNDGNYHNICISINALPAHIPGHPGDYCGPCLEKDLKKNDKSSRPGVESVVVGKAIDEASELSITAGPNPVHNIVRFVIQSKVSGHAELILFNSVGAKVGTPFNGFVSAGSSQTVEYRIPSTTRGSLLYVIKQGKNSKSGKLMAE